MSPAIFAGNIIIIKGITMKYLAVIFTLLLAGCGSSSDSEKNVTLAGIVGTWDESVELGQEVDELYSIIKADGSIIRYDYYGDSFNQGENCYDKYEYVTLVDQGEGDFSVEYDGTELATVKLTLSGNTMEISWTDEEGSFTNSSVRSDLTEDDFTPLCNDF